MHEAAVAHNRDKITHADRLIDVVRHEDDRLAEAAKDSQEFFLKPCPYHGVDSSKGLVHEHDRRIGRECTGDPDALALATREMPWVTVAYLCRVESDQVEHLVGTGADARCRPAKEFRNRGNVLSDGHVGEEPYLLDDVADAAAECDCVYMRDILSLNQDAPVCRLDQPVHHAHRCGLAAAGGADQNASCAFRHVQVEIIDSRAWRAWIEL